MKKGNLYKLMATLMALVFISAMSFAQNTDKDLKKKKTMLINVEVDENGTTTTIDTIVIHDHEMILKEVHEEMEMNHEYMKEMKIEILSELDGAHQIFEIQMEENMEDLQSVFEDLQKELANLEIDKEARQRIDEAVKKLENVNWDQHAEHLKVALLDAHHNVMMIDDDMSKMIIKGEDSIIVKTKVIRIDQDGKAPSDQEMNVWVTDDDGEHQVIIKKVGGEHSDKHMIFVDGDGHKKHHKGTKIVMISKDGDRNISGDMIMLSTADEKDIKRAKEAGIDIDMDQKLEITHINLEIKDDEAKVGLKTTEEGKMKISFLDEKFNKAKQIKAVEKDGIYEFPFQMKELKEKNVKYLLINQNKKSGLMKL